MISLDEDALICDLAETYQIYDYKSLPVHLVATFSAGLRENSRIKMIASGSEVPLETLLLASISDRVEAFRCSFGDGSVEPQSILATLLGQGEQRRGYKTAEDFEQALARIRGGN